MGDTEENTPGLDYDTAKEWIYPTNYAVREYQKNIVTKALFQNTLVSLPTGLGKTFIAAVVMYNFNRWYPHHKIIFMAHSKPLVAQQIDACCHIMGISKSVTAELNGNISCNVRKQHWESKQIFFLTPQVFNNDLTRGLVPAESIRCVVIDEAHKALGNQAFCQSIRALQPFNKSFRVLALSATPGDDIPMVKNVIENLLISHLELRTEEDRDIKKYLHEKKVEAVVVSLDAKIMECKNQLMKIAEKYLQQLIQMKAINANFGSLSSFSLVLKQKQFISNPSVGPDQRGFVLSNFSLVISIYKALEELVVHGLRSFHNKLITMKTGEGSTNNVHHRLNKDLEFLKLIEDIEKYIGQDMDIAFDPNVSMAQLQNELETEVEGKKQPIVYSHPKFVMLEQIVVEHFEEWKGKNESTRVIVFCKSRPCTGEICNFLNRFTPLIKPMVLIGQSQASGGSTSRGLKQSAQLEVMRKFREGTYNTLVATCVGEEGLDVGEVDLIVNFDATRNSNTQVQRSGRTGRKRDGRVVNLLTEGKEYQDYNVAVSKSKNITKKLANGIKNLPLYPNSPRLLPEELQPICQEMFLKPVTEVEQKQQKKTNDTKSKRKPADAKLKINTEDVTKSKRKNAVNKKPKKGKLMASQSTKYDIRYAMSKAEEKFKSQIHHDDTSDSLFESIGAVEIYKNVNKGLKNKQECLTSPIRNIELISLEDSMDCMPDVIINEQVKHDNNKITTDKVSLVTNFSLDSINLEMCDELDKLDINDLLNLVSKNKNGVKMPEKYLNYEMTPLLMPKIEEKDDFDFEFIDIPLSEEMMTDLPASFPEWISSPSPENVTTPTKPCVTQTNNDISNKDALCSTPKPNVSLVTVTQAISMIASLQKRQIITPGDKNNETSHNISQFPSGFNFSACESGDKNPMSTKPQSPDIKLQKQPTLTFLSHSKSETNDEHQSITFHNFRKSKETDSVKDTNETSNNISEFPSNFNFSFSENVNAGGNKNVMLSKETSPVLKFSKPKHANKHYRTTKNISLFPSDIDFSVCENLDEGKNETLIASNETSPVLKFSKPKHANIHNISTKNLSLFPSSIDFSVCEDTEKNKTSIATNAASPVLKFTNPNRTSNTIAQLRANSDFSLCEMLDGGKDKALIASNEVFPVSKFTNSFHSNKANETLNSISQFPSNFDFSVVENGKNETLKKIQSPDLKVVKQPVPTPFNNSLMLLNEEELIINSPEMVEKPSHETNHLPLRISYEEDDELGSPSMVSFSTYNNRESSKVKKSLNFENEIQILDPKLSQASQSSLGFLNLDSDDDIFADDEKERVILTQRDAMTYGQFSPVNEVKTKPEWPPSTHKNTPKTAIVRPMGFENMNSSSFNNSEWLSAGQKSKTPTLISLSRKKVKNKKVEKSQKPLDSFVLRHSVETPARVPPLHNYHDSLDQHSSTFDCIPEDLANFFDDTPFVNNAQTSTPVPISFPNQKMGSKSSTTPVRHSADGNYTLKGKQFHNNASTPMVFSVQKKNKRISSPEILMEDDLSDGALEAIRAVEDFEKKCKPIDSSVNHSTQSDPAVFNLWSSDDSDDIFEKSKSKNENSHAVSTSSKTKRRKKSSKVCIGRKKKNPFVEDEADMSEGNSGVSSDDENTSGLDDLDSSFLDERLAPTQAPDVDMTAKYLATVRSPRVVPGGFKIPERVKTNFNVFSQVVHDDEDYEHDSFCVPEDSELVDNELSYLELAELALKNKKKRRRKKSSDLSILNPKKKKRRRIITADSSSDEETASKENFKTPPKLEGSSTELYNKFCTSKPNGVVVNKNSVLLSNKCVTKWDNNIQKLVFIGSRQIESAPEITISLRSKFNFKVEVRSCPGADFIVGWRLGINRITLSDFCNGSPTIKTSFRESLLKLTALFIKPILIVEDDKNKGVSKTVGCHKDMWMKHSAKRLTRLCTSGVTTLFSRNKEETAKLIAQLTENECAKGHGILLDKEISPELEATLKFYTSLPGINIALALRFCRKFSTLSCFLSSCDSVDVLVRDIQIPKSTAINIYQALHLSLNS